MTVYLVIFGYNYAGDDGSSIKVFSSRENAKDYLLDCRVCDGRYKDENGDYGGIRDKIVTIAIYQKVPTR
jgi:hypothetical protein